MKVGIIGSGKIIHAALACMKMAGIETTALWCRNAEKGKPFCEQYGMTLYTDLEAFLQDDSYDVVYNALINSLHYEYTKKALQAKKHCIVEKPFTSTLKETLKLVELAEENGVMLFEAIMSRYSRNYEEIRKHLDEIGEIKLVSSTYCQYSSRYNDYLKGIVLPAFDPALSGGALYDINIYNLHFVEGIFGAPQQVSYGANLGFNGIDTSGIVMMDYGSFKAVCTGAKDSACPNGSRIMGTKGYIALNDRPGFVHDVILHLNDGTEKILDTVKEENPMMNEFARIADIYDRGDTVLASRWLQDTVNVMRILEACRNSAGIVFAADEK